MIVRPIDGFGDMMPVSNISDMASGAEAVAVIVRERLGLCKGEWWEDETIGVQLPQFLADTLRPSDASMVAKYITSYVAQSEGVEGVKNVSMEYSNRTLKYSAVVLSGEGSARVEVDLSGVL